MHLIASRRKKMNTEIHAHQDITTLNIEEIFDSSTQYKIPMYQRGFAWRKDQLKQLISDIKNSELGKEYFLGSLIVHRQSGKDTVYEVIDGQQRLTALFLIKCVLQHNPCPTSIEFECRKKASDTLNLFATTKWENFKESFALLEEDYPNNSLDNDLCIGLQNIHEIFQSDDFKGNDEKKALLDFNSKLKTLRLFRVEVPLGTDLNLYFERMNTRAEQLEQADIVKALLMKNIANNSQCSLFASIWTACSNMNGFVQMGFSPDLRKKLFKGKWMTLDDNNLEVLFHQTDSSQNPTETDQKECPRPTLKSILSDPKKFAISYGTENTEKKSNSATVQLRSIIEFPVFLIHALKIFKHSYQKEQLIGEIEPHDLDDVKLVEYFKSEMAQISKSSIDEVDKSKQLCAFAINFIKCLLKLRFLFDKYIVKRELLSSESDLEDNGVWRISSLKEYRDEKNKKSYSSVTTLDGKLESSDADNEDQNYEYNSQCKMIQSCLRVAYTSPRSMHWITLLLDDIYTHYRNGLDRIYLKNISDQAKRYAIVAVRDYLRTNEGCRPYSLGVGTPHIVFHFLDYLLWEIEKKKKESFEFEFKFRNSVEHWYPQHISSDVGGSWSHEEGLDDFGNLCIVTTSVNSKFSNQSPKQKSENINLIKEGSLKLQKMAELTKRISLELKDDKAANEAWKVQYIDHQNRMIELLVNACK